MSGPKPNAQRGITVLGRVMQLVNEHGSVSAAARAVGLSRMKLDNVYNGVTHQPREDVIRAIGLDPYSGRFDRLQD